MQNKIAISHSDLVNPQPATDVENYHSPSTARRWELSIGWKTKLYLTDEEHDYYLQQLKIGKKIVLVGELVLTKSFNYLIPIRNKPKPAEFGKIKYY